MPAPYRGVLFDLFGTLVVFEPTRLPTLMVGDHPVPTTVGALGARLEAWVRGVGLADFYRALREASEEMARERASDHVERPSRERFQRALERVGCADEVIIEAAADLSRVHMACIAAATVFPSAHAAVLTAARAHGSVGVVSNFDDTATAYEILRRHDILPQLDTVVISEAVGLRKPHPALVRIGLRGLGCQPGEVLFVGDTFGEDVAAAHGAGVDAAWIDVRGTGVPDGGAPPAYVVGGLPDLLPVVRRPLGRNG